VAAHGDQRRDFFSVFPIYLVASGVRLWVGVSVCVCVWGVRTSKKSPKSRKNRFTQDPSRPHSPTKWTPSGPLFGHFDHQRLRAHCRTAGARDQACVRVCLALRCLGGCVRPKMSKKSKKSVHPGPLQTSFPDEMDTIWATFGPLRPPEAAGTLPHSCCQGSGCLALRVCVCVFGVCAPPKKSRKSRKNRFTQDPCRPHSPTKWTPSRPLFGHVRVCAPGRRAFVPGVRV
jgi:hypothetical protein